MSKLEKIWKTILKIGVTLLAIYNIFYDSLMLIWMWIGGRILWLTPMGILGEANELNWYIPIINIIPLIILIIFIWKKNGKTQDKKDI